MNVLQLSPERNGLVQFTNEYVYNHQSSPPDSINSDSSDTSQQKIVETVYLNTWEGTGEFPDCGDVKDIVLFKESQEPVIEDVKEVVAFHHLPRNVCPTICAVCGDRATGYHYEVPSCNGCKTFFRRTVLSQRKYDCIRGGKCFNVLPKEKRCSCRSCRFKKCVEVGMNPLAIQTNDSLNDNTLVSKIVSKRKVSDSETPSTSKTFIPTDVISIDQSIDKLIDGLVYLEIKVEEFRKCSFNPPNEQYAKLNKLLDQHSLIALADRCGPMPNWPLGQLTREEWHAFREKGSFEPMTKDRKNWFVYDILTSVEYAKTFMFMHKIGREDQIRLLKSVVLKLMHLNQSYYSYENKREMILHPDGTSPQFPKHVLESAGFPSSKNTDEDRTRFLSEMCASILALMRNRLDKKEYVLFKAITLCNATVPGLSERCREIVTEEKQKFTNALLKYCLANRGANGPAHFAACLALSNHLENHQKKQKDFHVLIKMMKSTKVKRHGHPDPLPHDLVEDVMED